MTAPNRLEAGVYRPVAVDRLFVLDFVYRPEVAVHIPVAVHSPSVLGAAHFLYPS